MKRIFLIFITLPFFQEVNAQLGIMNNDVQANTYPGAQVYEIPVRKPGLVGSPYLNDDWLIGNVSLKNGGEIKFAPIKYDILNSQVLFRETKRVMMVKLNYVDSFSLLQPNGKYFEFIINKTWTNDSKDASGVYQTLSKIESYGLLKRHEIVLIKANYNVAMSTGVKDDRFKKKFKLYFLNTVKNEVEIVPNGKKKIGLYFNNEKITSYIKTNKPNLKEEEGLIELIEFANSIQTEQIN